MKWRWLTSLTIILLFTILLFNYPSLGYAYEEPPKLNIVINYAGRYIPNSTNLLANPGFETGDLSGWSYYPSPTDIEVVNTTVYSGNYSCHIGGVNEDDNMINGEELYQEVGDVHIYKISFYVNIDPGNVDPDDYLDVYYINSTGDDVLLDSITQTSGWVYKEYTVNDYGKGVKFIPHVMRSGSDLDYADMYIDDVSLTVSGQEWFVHKNVAGSTVSESTYEYEVEFDSNAYELYIIIPETWSIEYLRSGSSDVPYELTRFSSGGYNLIYINSSTLSSYGSPYTLRVNDGGVTEYGLKHYYELENIPLGSLIKVMDTGLLYRVYGSLDTSLGVVDNVTSSGEYIYYIPGEYTYIRDLYITLNITSSSSQTIYAYYGFSQDNTTFIYTYVGEFEVDSSYKIIHLDYSTPSGSSYKYISLKLTPESSGFNISSFSYIVFYGETTVSNIGSYKTYIWYDGVYATVENGSTYEIPSYIYELRILFNVTRFKVVLQAEDTGESWSFINSSLIFKYWNNTIESVDLGDFDGNSSTILYFNITDLGLSYEDVAKEILYNGWTRYFFTLNINESGVWRSGNVNRELTCYILLNYPLYPTILDVGQEVIAVVKTLTLKTVSGDIYSLQVQVYLEKGVEYYIELYDTEWNYIGLYYTQGGSGEISEIIKVENPDTTQPNATVSSNATLNYGIPSLPEALKSMYAQNQYFMDVALLSMLIMFLLVAGYQYGGVMIILTGALAYAINYTLGETIFNNYVVGTLIFVGILSIFYEWRRRR